MFSPVPYTLKVGIKKRNGSNTVGKVIDIIDLLNLMSLYRQSRRNIKLNRILYLNTSQITTRNTDKIKVVTFVFSPL